VLPEQIGRSGVSSVVAPVALLTIASALDRHIGDGLCAVGERARDCYEPAQGRLAEVRLMALGMSSL
jgi:hypothetical protein